jgi:hypothetical protein
MVLSGFFDCRANRADSGAYLIYGTQFVALVLLEALGLRRFL